VLPTDGRSEEDVVVPEAPARKTHSLTDGRKDPLLAKMVDQESHFAKPGRAARESTLKRSG